MAAHVNLKRRAGDTSGDTEEEERKSKRANKSNRKAKPSRKALLARVADLKRTLKNAKVASGYEITRLRAKNRYLKALVLLHTHEDYKEDFYGKVEITCDGSDHVVEPNLGGECRRECFANSADISVDIWEHVSDEETNHLHQYNKVSSALSHLPSAVSSVVMQYACMWMARTFVDHPESGLVTQLTAEARMSCHPLWRVQHFYGGWTRWRYGYEVSADFFSVIDYSDRPEFKLFSLTPRPSEVGLLMAAVETDRESREAYDTIYTAKEKEEKKEEEKKGDE